MLKIIGKLPLPKSWAVTLVKSTGHYIVDYMPDCAPSAKFNADVEGAKTELKAAFPDGRPEKMEYPGHATTPEAKEAREKYHAHSQKTWHFDHLTGLQDKEALDYHPVFEGVLGFVGYSRGRSKVTMDFIADNGQEIPFGASGISELMQHIANGNIKIVDDKYHIVFTLEKKGANVYAYPHYPESE